jgi:hypothetical protein
MPLLDHFHGRLSELRPWESFHACWASTLADLLNRDILPPGYIALEQVHAGTPVEIDVATLTESTAPARANGGGGTATMARTVWTPVAAPLLLPAVFPPRFTVEIHNPEGGRTLVGAIELVSPGNKDRVESRRLFAAKCATYLSRGVGLIIVDVVTKRKSNLHNELVKLLGLEAVYQMPLKQRLYTVAYRPLRVSGKGRIETWPYPLAIGQAMPTMPLSLHAECCVPVDFEAAYSEACQRRRVNEIVS